MRRVRILCANLIIAILVAFSLPAIASAHVLKQDNGISAVLHVPPEDNPTVGEKTELNVAFGDETNKFSLQNCDCHISIALQGKNLQTLKAEPALSGATQDSAVDVTFPKTGLYHVLLTGSATDKSFKNFKLDYTLKVSSGNTSMNSSYSGEIIIIAIGSLIILSMFAYTGIKFGGRYRKDLP